MCNNMHGHAQPFRSKQAIHQYSPMNQKTQNHPHKNTDIQIVVVDLAEKATTWFRDIREAVQTSPAEIHIHLLGGVCAPLFEIISLRNALLLIPKHIKLVTVAACSLPPLACAAWLAGDERHIAQDAVVWIPNVPEHLMKGPTKTCHSDSWVESENESESDEEDDSDEQTTNRISPSGFLLKVTKSGFSLGHRRRDRDIQTLCGVINEWLPCWEFKGSCLNVTDLIEWNVVQPEWVFGGQSARTRHLSASTTRAGTSTTGTRASS